MARPIVLLTDYGGEDFYAGVTRTVVAAASPASPVVDLTHDIPAHDVARASFVLARSWDYLPHDAVVVVVVDPGVGTERRGLVAEVAARRERRCVVNDDGVAVILEGLAALHDDAAFDVLDRELRWFLEREGWRINRDGGRLQQTHCSRSRNASLITHLKIGNAHLHKSRIGPSDDRKRFEEIHSRNRET
jgi:hypothetical protein